MQKIASIILFLAILTKIGFGAISHPIYKIQASNFKDGWPKRSQTGFLATIGGKTGIVTALHGVAGAGTISASCEDRKFALRDRVSILSVDIKNDIALLTSSELQGKRYEGIPVEEHPDWTKVKAIEFYGFSYGNSLKSSTGEIRQNPTPAFRSFFSGDSEEAVKAREVLGERGSPALDQIVVDIQAVFHPGDSGGPVFDSLSKNVIGVVNGGLKEGFAQLCWAIPCNNVAWAIYDRNKIANLLKEDPKDLFSMPLEDSPIAKPKPKMVKIVVPPLFFNGYRLTCIIRKRTFDKNDKEKLEQVILCHNEGTSKSLSLPIGEVSFELEIYTPDLAGSFRFSRKGDFEIEVDEEGGTYQVGPIVDNFGSMTIDVQRLDGLLLLDRGDWLTGLRALG